MTLHIVDDLTGQLLATVSSILDWEDAAARLTRELAAQLQAGGEGSSTVTVAVRLIDPDTGATHGYAELTPRPHPEAADPGPPSPAAAEPSTPTRPGPATGTPATSPAGHLEEPQLRLPRIAGADHYPPVSAAPWETRCETCDGLGVVTSAAWAAWNDHASTLGERIAADPDARDALLDQLEQARPDDEQDDPCPDCDATGTTPTSDGLALLAFLRRHLNT